MARIAIAGLVAGLVVFLWGAVAHMALPLGMIGMQIPPEAQQQAALAGLREHLGSEGVHVLPMPQESAWEDEAQMQAFGARAAQQPYAFVVFQPQGRDSMAAMGGQLATQAASTMLAGLIAAFVAAGCGSSRAQRIGIVTALGVFAWLAIAVPQWNWWRFPTDFTLAALAEHAIGWLLGGIAIALILRPRTR